jgi:diguanylate cyclase (GGDEF)-like protein
MMTRPPVHRFVPLWAAVLILTAHAAGSAFWQEAPGAQSIARQSTLVDARTITGIATLLVAGLLSLLYFYRRRAYIVCWIAGWILIAASGLIATPQFAGQRSAAAAYGISQFLAVASALLFLLSADAYRMPLRQRRGYALVLVPLSIWFALAPLALNTRQAIFVPGHLLTAGGLAAAGVAYLRLLRETRLLGAAVIGSTILLLAASHVGVVIGGDGPAGTAVERGTLVSLALYLVAALGMQLMTFEDMTYELRLTNKRLESAQGELQQLVTTDPLTGCRNRRYFHEVISREMERHRRYHIPLSLLFVDVDRFKAINDALGHDSGDRVLQRVAVFLVRNVREADYVFRWGGDEFLILMSCREEQALHKAKELQKAFASSPEPASLPSGVGLSVGCAEVPPDATDIMAIVKIADERMYRDKKR